MLDHRWVCLVGVAISRSEVGWCLVGVVITRSDVGLCLVSMELVIKGCVPIAMGVVGWRANFLI
jgi:hypothetical protein